MVILIFAAQALEDFHSFINRRRLHFHGLETAFQSGVFLNVFAILIERRGTHALQFSTAECGLNDVARVHRAFGRTGTDYGVQLVDK